MPTFPYVKRSYQHLDHPRKKRKSHYRLGLNRAIASSTILHEEASALRSQYYLSRIDLVHYPMGRVVLRRSCQKILHNNSALKLRAKLRVEPLKTFLHKTYDSTACCREDHCKGKSKERTKLATNPLCLRVTTLFCTKWKGRSRVGALRYRLGLPRRDRHTGPLGSPFYASGKDAQSLRPRASFLLSQKPCC